MTTGEEYERKASGIEDFTGETPWSQIEMLESHYDMIAEKWFFYIRARYKNEAQYKSEIYQVTMKE